MRCSPTLLAAAVCALSATAVCAQTTTPSSTLLKIPPTMSFSYDAQHDHISANGLEVKPSIKSNASVTPTTGTITVAININLASHFAKGTSIHCSVMAIGGMLDLSNGTVDGALETANGIAMSNGSGSATCMLSIPYSWTLPPDPTAQSGLILVFGASAQWPHGENSIVQRSTLQLDGIENLPASGTTSKYAFDVTL